MSSYIPDPYKQAVAKGDRYTLTYTKTAGPVVPASNLARLLELRPAVVVGSSSNDATGIAPSVTIWIDTPPPGATLMTLLNGPWLVWEESTFLLSRTEQLVGVPPALVSAAGALQGTMQAAADGLHTISKALPSPTITVTGLVLVAVVIAAAVLFGPRLLEGRRA